VSDRAAAFEFRARWLKPISFDWKDGSFGEKAATEREVIIGGEVEMKLTSTLFLVVFAIFCVANSARAQTGAFTYQGKLSDGGSPANGSYDLQFALFDSLAGGTQIGSTLTLAGTTVTSGAFSVQLDFEVNAFPGANRFIETSVRPAGSGTFTLLTPRQQITSTPYAIRSATATNAESATNATELGGVAAGQYVLTTDARMTDARPPTSGSGNYIQNTASQQSNSNLNISGNGIVNGRIGVGTNAPVSKLDVRGNMSIGLTAFAPGIFGANSLFVANDDGGDPNNYFRMDGSGNTLYIVAASQPGATKGAGITFRTGAAGTTEADRVRISEDGRVGIGTTAPIYALDVKASPDISGAIGGESTQSFGAAVIGHARGSGSTGVLGIGDDLSRGFAGFFDGRVSVTGNVGIGTNAPQRLLHVNGKARIGSMPLDASAASVCFNAAGDLLQCGASSLRLKANVTQFLGGLDVIRRLKPISFDWKDGSGRDIGLGAEDVASVDRSFTFTDSNGDVAGVKYERLNLLLINAVKEQQQQIEKQQAQIASLLTANKNLNTRLQTLERNSQSRRLREKRRRERETQSNSK
jgi:Chaperone of endosialidase